MFTSRSFSILTEYILIPSLSVVVYGVLSYVSECIFVMKFGCGRRTVPLGCSTLLPEGRAPTSPKFAQKDTRPRIRGLFCFPVRGPRRRGQYSREYAGPRTSRISVRDR